MLESIISFSSLHWTFYSLQKNWVFATNSHLLTPISLQPDDVSLRLFYLTEMIVLNIKGLGKRVAKL